MSLLTQGLKVHSPRSIRLVIAAIERAERRGLVAPGIADDTSRAVFAQQIIESIRRVQFVMGLNGAEVSPRRLDPNDNAFDPIRGAAHLKYLGEIEEAAWLVFLSTHFGQRPDTKWSLVAAFYKGDNAGPWTWQRSASNVALVRAWIAKNESTLRQSGRFGNHRKYESLDAFSGNGTGSVIESYVEWIQSYGSHQQLFAAMQQRAHLDREHAFALMYEDMRRVHRFGRTAKFDYLTMLGKLEIAEIWPGSMFTAGSTGPKRGGRMLLGRDDASSAEIEHAVSLIDGEMSVGMQVFEDALCNWQKSPDRFLKFRG